MNKLAMRTFWGLLLIAGGIVLFLENLNLISFGGLIWSPLIGLASLGFLSVYVQDRQHWWALIPGFVLLATSVTILLTEVFPGRFELAGGVVILGGIGLAFLVVFLTNRENWWAVIPAGVLFTLAAVTGLSQALQGVEIGGVFFLGLGLTFALVGVLPTPQGKMRWAFIPSGVLLLIGLVILAAGSNLINMIWPAVLILGGLFLIFRALRSRR